MLLIKPSAHIESHDDAYEHAIHVLQSTYCELQRVEKALGILRGWLAKHPNTLAEKGLLPILNHFNCVNEKARDGK